MFLIPYKFLWCGWASTINDYLCLMNGSWESKEACFLKEEAWSALLRQPGFFGRVGPGLKMFAKQSVCVWNFSPSYIYIPIILLSIWSEIHQQNMARFQSQEGNQMNFRRKPGLLNFCSTKWVHCGTLTPEHLYVDITSCSLVWYLQPKASHLILWHLIPAVWSRLGYLTFASVFPPPEYPGNTTSMVNIITVCDVFHMVRLFLTHLPLLGEDEEDNGDTCLLECL